MCTKSLQFERQVFSGTKIRIRVAGYLRSLFNFVRLTFRSMTYRKILRVPVNPHIPYTAPATSRINKNKIEEKKKTAHRMQTHTITPNSHKFPAYMRSQQFTVGLFNVLCSVYRARHRQHFVCIIESRFAVSAQHLYLTE